MTELIYLDRKLVLVLLATVLSAGVIGYKLASIEPNSSEELLGESINVIRPAIEGRTLRQYVCKALNAVVVDFEHADYQAALLELARVKLDERKDPIYQPAFIRGLCLQAMGKFAEAAGEYATVKEFSKDLLLKTKSEIGLQCCSKKQSSIPAEMLTFPPRWEGPDMCDIPLPLMRR